MTTDERLAALEAKMDALTAPPSDYYTSQYSGEEIDAAITLGASTAAEVVDKADKTQLCNPNLLDNWYFGRPVNQRGQTEYSGSAGYWIDRWKRDAGIVCTVDGSMVTCTQLSAGNNAISQLLEGYTGLAGQAVTLSVLCAGTPGTSVTVGHNDGGSSVYETYTPCTGALQLIQSTFTVAAAPTQFAAIIRAQFSANFAEETVKFLAAKLELGDTQTLAHQDADGNWVLNEIPDYGEQLRRCQRHQTQICSGDNGFIGIGTATSATDCKILIPIPTTLRTTPAITYSGSFVLIAGAGNGSVPVTAMSIQFHSNNAVSISCTTAGSLTAGSPYKLYYLSNAAKLLLDANL